MPYINKEDMDTVARSIVRDVVEQFAGKLSNKDRDYAEYTVLSIIGRFTGLRFEDGKDRLYDATLLEGEPYVYD